MGLAQMQEAMARLYTDAALREQFFDDPQSGGGALGLNTDETRQLAQLSRRQVSFFACSLHNKRLIEISKLLPLTHRMLGPRFAELFRRYANTHVPAGTKRHREEALAFSAFVEQVAITEGIARWIVEAARYQAAWLKMADPSWRYTVRWFRYPVITPAARPNPPAAAPLAHPTLALWFRLSRRGRLRHVVLSVPPGRMPAILGYSSFFC